MTKINDSDIGAFVRKRILGGGKIETLRSAMILAHANGDTDLESILERVIEREITIRRLLGMRDTVSGGTRWRGD